jgi:DNA-binding beta-propeller fold protein YncE
MMELLISTFTKNNMDDNLQVLGTLIGWAGINTDFLPEKLPPEDESVYLTDGDNIIIKNGRIKKLRGTDYLNNVSTQLGESSKRNVLGVPIYRKYDGTKQLLAVLPSKLYQLVSDTTWTIKGTISGGLNDSILTYANAGDKFYFVLNDSGTVYEWDGSTFQAVTFTAAGVGAG